MNTPLPIDPIAELSAWSEQLQAIAREPLAYREDFPQVARRFDAWWEQAIDDRPVFLATAPRDGNPLTRRLDLLTQPDAWFDAKLHDLNRTHHVGDSLPAIRADFGAVLLGGMLGGDIEFGSDTTWTHAFINDDWSNAPDWQLADDNRWWRLLRELTERVAADAPGRYLVCTPDLGGSADVLLNFRGAQGLCMDVAMDPERVRAAIDAIYPAWRTAFHELYRISLGAGAGLVHWLGLWCSRPHMVPACDFNFMIGPDHFEQVCLPDIQRQAATAGHAVFHLDGPGAARHIDALLEVPEIQAIQFTPGEGAPSTLPWIGMFRKVQAKGRSLLVITPAEEAVELAEALQPEGLAIWTGGPPDKLDAVFAAFEKRYTG